MACICAAEGHVCVWVLVSTSDSVSAYNLALNLHTCEASLSIEVHEDNWHFSAEESTLERKWRQILDESQLILHVAVAVRFRSETESQRLVGPPSAGMSIMPAANWRRGSSTHVMRL